MRFQTNNELLLRQWLFCIVAIMFFACSCKTSGELNVAKKHPKKYSNEQLSVKKAVEKQESDFFDAEKKRLAGETKQAKHLYYLFVNNYPNNATAHYTLGKLYYQTSDITLAEKEAKKATELNPTNFYFRELYAQTLYAQNKLKDADNQFDELIKQKPEHAEYVFKKAMLAEKNKSYSKAIVYLNEYEKLEGFYEDVCIHRKDIYLKQNKPKEAIQELRRLQAQDPHTVQYPVMIATIYEDYKMLDSAKMEYEYIDKNFTNEPFAQVALAQFYLEQKNKTKYNYYMHEVMKNKNLSADTKVALLFPSLQLLSIDTNLVKKDELMSLSESLYKESPESKEAKALYADVLYYTKGSKESLPIYLEYLQKDSSKINIWSQIMSIQFEQQQYDSVIKTSDFCLKQFKENPVAYFYQGISFTQLKQSSAAIKALTNAYKFSKDENSALKIQILSNLADAFNTNKEFDKSDSTFNEALKLSPDDASVLNNYSYYLSLRKHRLEDAEKMSKRSLELQPNQKSFLDTYGWIRYQQGKYDDAKKYIEKAIQFGGENDGTLFEHLGDVYFKLNQAEQAIMYWNMAVNNGEKNETLLKKTESKKIND